MNVELQVDKHREALLPASVGLGFCTQIDCYLLCLLKLTIQYVKGHFIIGIASINTLVNNLKDSINFLKLGFKKYNDLNGLFPS